MHVVARIAWFSPLPPMRSGISAYSADLLPLLSRLVEVDVFDEAHAHDFVWKHGNRPYDLIVYQLGNSICHEYQWAYLARYPGLVVLHDAQLHQSRALSLLQRQRRDDYRREVAFSHPRAPAGLADLVIAGLGGSLYYLWPMLGVVMAAARVVAVHNEHLAGDLRERFPGVPVEAIHMGVPAVAADPSARALILERHRITPDAVVFACYGKVTPEKRIGQVLRALARVSRLYPNVHLLLVGESGGDYDVRREARDAGVDGRVTLAGFVDEARLPAYLQAADVCVCLRWPTARETSASWLRCLAAGKPTIVTGLVQIADIPCLDARSWSAAGDPARDPSGDDDAVCVSVDLPDEERSLGLAMARLASERALRERLGARARAYWEREHTLERMLKDYERLIDRAIATPIPSMSTLPSHFRDDATDLARRLIGPLGVRVDFLST
jgi:glycosyltransferase involved in cell wall biosynthesis